MSVPARVTSASSGQMWTSMPAGPHGPGWRCYVRDTGMLLVVRQGNGYRWWLQTGPSKAMPGRGGFADPGDAMDDAARSAGGLAPRMFAGLTRDELLALYRQLARAYPQHRDGSGVGDRWHRELEDVRAEVFRQMEITALDPFYIGPQPAAFAQAARLASFGAVTRAELASPQRPNWLRPRPARPALLRPARRRPAGLARARAGRLL